MEELARLLAELGVDVALDRLDGLGNDELAGLRDQLADAARAAGESDEVNTETAGLVAGAVVHVKAIDHELENRAAMVASARADVTAALSQIDVAAVPLTATGGKTRSTVQVPARHRPRVAAAPRTRIGRPGGNDYPSMIAAAQEFGHTVENAVRSHIGLREGERITAVQLDWSDQYPEERRLRGDDLTTTTERMLGHRESLLASGGVPGPAEPRYSELVFGEADRPVRDSLPSFLSTRGELIWNAPPTLDDVVVANTGGAVGVVTNAQDVSGTTKTFQDIANPGTSSVFVRAIYTRMQFSNATARFLPERIASMMRLGTVAHAREAERNLLLDIKNASTKWTDLSAGFGAYRTLKPQVLAVVEEIRDHIRDDSVPIVAVFPDYLPALLATDIARQQPGDAAFNATVQQMKADVASWGVQPVWADESIRGRLLSTPAGGARTPNFDNDIEFAVFPAGTWLYLDAGQLDLGLVRDSTLNSTNKLQIFAENWEALAQLGPYSYWITSSLCADGASQAASAISVCSPQGS